MQDKAARPNKQPAPLDAPADKSPRAGRRLFAVPAIAFATIALLFAFALQKGDPSKLPSTLIGKPAPQMALEPVSGLSVAGKDLAGLAPAALRAGEPTVVNFWASWCQPCTDEHPLLMRLRQATGVTMVGINYKDQPASARRFLTLHGNPFAAVGADATGRAAIEWGVYSVPETFVVDGQGIIVYKHVGPLSLEALETKVLPAIEAARVAQKK